MADNTNPDNTSDILADNTNPNTDDNPDPDNTNPDNTSDILVDEKHLIQIAHNMYRSLPSNDAKYLPPDTLADSYALLWPRLNMYGRSIHIMNVDDGYFSAFSLQCWNTTEYRLFARFATLEYMVKNPRSYKRPFSEFNKLGSLKDHLEKYAKLKENGVYELPDELIIRASCDLFGVKLERLTHYGSRVFNEVVPKKHKYHKAISMSFMNMHADSMFVAGEQLPQPDPDPLSPDTIQRIRRFGSITPEDLLGSEDY